MTMADWEILTLMAAFVSVMLAALLIMFSRLFDFKMLEQAAKAELVFAASSVLVAVFLIGLVNYGTAVGKNVTASMYEYSYSHMGYLTYTYTDETGAEVETTLDPSTIQDPQYTLVEIVILYMRSVMNCMENMGLSAFWISMGAHQISTFSQDVYMSPGMGAWAWGGFAQAADNLLNTIYFMELIFRIQIYVLRFMDVFSIAYLLPIGIIMRAFPPTRGAGAYVIAFTVGLYLVFPLSYLAAVFSSTNPALCATPEIPPPPMEGTSKVSFVSSITLWYEAFEDNIVDAVSKFSDFTNTLITNLCFFPFVAFAITLTFIQASNGLFGANVPEIGRGLVKLI